MAIFDRIHITKSAMVAGIREDRGLVYGPAAAMADLFLKGGLKMKTNAQKVEEMYHPGIASLLYNGGSAKKAVTEALKNNEDYHRNPPHYVSEIFVMWVRHHRHNLDWTVRDIEKFASNWPGEKIPCNNPDCSHWIDVPENRYLCRNDLDCKDCRL